MGYFLLGLTVILAGFRSVFSKIGNKYITQKNDMLNFNFLLFLAGGILITLKYIIDRNFMISFYTVGLSILYAYFTLMSQILFMKATGCGDVALSSLIYSCGFLFPTVFGIVAYKEDITVIKSVGVLAVLLSFAVGATPKSKAVCGKWFVYSFSAMVSSGMVGIIQKVFRMSKYKEQINGFLLIAFLIIIISILVIMPAKEKNKFSRGFFITSIAIGICFGMVNIINTYLSGVIPSFIMFPVVNGGGIVSSGILAYLIIQERLSLRKWLGILIGIAGITLIAI